MAAIKVVVRGALGRVGKVLVTALCSETDMQLVGALDVKATKNVLPLPDESGEVPLSADLDTILDGCKPDVIVDFSNTEAVMPAVQAAAKRGISLVIGTTGLSADERAEMDRIAKDSKIGIVMAPNFALGAVLMMHLSKIAAKYMDYAEIIELHHHLKADAPSGTALQTARAMAEARKKPFSRPEVGNDFISRGEEVEGVSVHAVRLPGLMAHQEVILGAPGQTLSIRHDTINRECYVPGIMIAIKEVVKRQGMTYGLDVLLDLQG
ncbi:4-hydroxy-tetrahydrodipicolinate reductase [Chloroflexota bacterium]